MYHKPMCCYAQLLASKLTSTSLSMQGKAATSACNVPNLQICKAQHAHCLQPEQQDDLASAPTCRGKDGVLQDTAPRPHTLVNVRRLQDVHA